MTSYQTLTERLKKNPVLEQPEQLTQTVIERIERMEANRLKHKVMYIAGWFSAVAAALLFGLLILETLQLPENYRMKTEKVVITPVTFDVYRERAAQNITGKRNIVTAIIKDKLETNRRKDLYIKLIKQNKTL
ncbi:MAG: hypothetical protein LBU62_05370 [Bacteroidales bacterium]|nr:hypothetical protein [Bacteroidales bacterium]